MPTPGDTPETIRITAPPGTEEHERQTRLQRGAAVQACARVPLVRVVCGLLTIVYCFIVVGATFSVYRSQLTDGFDLWEILVHAGYTLLMWWVISMQGRIALYGEFGTELGLFAPRQPQA